MCCLCHVLQDNLFSMVFISCVKLDICQSFRIKNSVCHYFIVYTNDTIAVQYVSTEVYVACD